MLENLKEKNKAVGVKQTAKAIAAGKAKSVFFANDADSKVVATLIEQCEKSKIEIVKIESMKQLGKACGIEIGAAVAALLID